MLDSFTADGSFLQTVGTASLDHPTIEVPLSSSASGYHPVKISDSFSENHYVVIRKLGWVTFQP
jgi:hypothetical protein